MKEFIFCPACLNQDELNLMKTLRSKQQCTQCGAKFSLNATLISEDALRAYIKERKGESDHLLDKLKRVGKEPSWFRKSPKDK